MIRPMYFGVGAVIPALALGYYAFAQQLSSITLTPQNLLEFAPVLCRRLG